MTASTLSLSPRAGAPGGVLRLVLIAALLLSVLLLAGCDSVEERAEKHYQNGLELVADDNEVKATLEFRNAVKLNENHVGANLELGKIFEGGQNFPAAVAQYRKVISLDASQLDAHLRLGQLMLAFNDVEKAVTSTLAAAQLAPDNVDVLVLESALALQLSDIEKARAKAARAVEVNPDNADVWIVQGAISRREGEREKALEQVEEGIRRDPESVKALLFRLTMLSELGRIDEIGATLKRLVELEPREESFWEALARWQLETKRFDEVEPTLRTLSRLNPDNAARVLDIVRLVGAMQGRNAAHEELTKLIAEREGTPVALELRIARAEFLIGDEDMEAAKAELAGVIEAAGSEDVGLTARGMLARLRLGEGDRAGALALVEDALEADPGYTEALKIRGRIRLLEEDYEGAVADLRAAEGQQPDDLEAIRLLALAFRRNGNPDLAVERLARAVDVSQNAVEPVLEYARHLVATGRSDFALEQIEKSLASNTDDIRLIEALARIKLAQGDFATVEQIGTRLRMRPETQDLGDRLLAAALAGQDRVEESIGVLEDAYDDENRETGGYLAALVATHLRRDDMATAERLVEDALVRDPEDTIAIRLKATLALVRGAPQEAMELFERAVRIEPGSAVNHLALFRLQNRLGDTEAAERTLAGGIAQTDSAILRLNRAVLLEQAGDIEGAIAEYERLYEQQPGSELIANNLASLMTDADPTQEQIERAYTIARRLRVTETPHFKDTYGWILHLRGDNTGALPRLEEAAEALPDNAVVQYHLGAVLAALGQTERAREVLERAISLGEGRPLPQIEAAQARLEALSPTQPAE